MNGRHAENCRAYLSLALTMRRISHQYRGWARDAERKGNLAEFTRWSAEADKCWQSAKINLDFAMREADFVPRSIAHAA